MKDLIRKILKEDQEDDGFDWADSVSNPPDVIMRDAGKRFKWETYVPILGKKIKFYINPEWWQPIARVDVENVESKGYGSFGDDPHREYQPSPLDILERGRDDSYYSKEVNLGKNGNNRERTYVDIEKVIDDLEGYSIEAKQHTDTYKQQIESITRDYMEKMSTLADKYNFNDDYGAEAVVVQPDGTIKTEYDFPNSRYNRR